DRDRADTGHHLTLRQVTMADHPLLALLRPQIGMLVEKVRDLGLDCLGEQGTGSIAQDFGELIVEESWLNQLDNVIVGHGISLLRWRSGGVKHPHDMPPSRFPPSPTFGDSSGWGDLAQKLASGQSATNTSIARGGRSTLHLAPAQPLNQGNH